MVNRSMRYIAIVFVLFMLVFLISQSGQAQGAALDAVTDQATQTATPILNAPWVAQMKLITTGPNANAGVYTPPATVVSQIGKDWNLITEHYIAYPKQLVTSDQMAAYFAASTLATPVATDASDDIMTPTPMNMSTVYNIPAPLVRKTIIIGCQQNGAVCILRDTWSSLAVRTFNAQGKVIKTQAAPGYYSDILAQIAWDTTDQHWKILTWADDTEKGTPPKEFTVATLTPTLVATSPAVMDQATQSATPVPDAPWVAQMKLITTGDNAGKNLYNAPQSVLNQISKDWNAITLNVLVYPSQVLSLDKIQQYFIPQLTPSDSSSGSVATPTPSSTVDPTATYAAWAPVRRNARVIACQSNGAVCWLRDTWTLEATVTYDSTGKKISSQTFAGYYTDIFAQIIWDPAAKHWKINTYQMDTEKGTPPDEFMAPATAQPSATAHY